MSAAVQPSPWRFSSIASMQALEGSLTRLSAQLRSPLTPPASPRTSLHDDECLCAFDSTSILSERHHPNTPTSPKSARCDPQTSSSTSSSHNIIAIDNKIEQAMDLVKTHLTFAVREEVDVLRGTINELEAKIKLLEAQNGYMMQFVPPEVVQTLKEPSTANTTNATTVPPASSSSS